MKVNWEVLLGALLIAVAVLFVGRYQISAFGYDGRDSVYRLDRWTGETEYCVTRAAASMDGFTVECPAKVRGP